MESGGFWGLLADARTLGFGDMEDEADMLGSMLSRLEPEEIVAFARMFRERDRELYRWDIYAAAHILNGGCDEACFQFFRWYVIGMGREIYEGAVADADSLELLAKLSLHQFAYDAEALGYAASEAHERVAGEPLPDLGEPFPIEPDGEPWDPETPEVVVPRIARAVGWNEV